MIGTIRVESPIAAARREQRPVVTLETSVIGQGLPYPRNVECRERMEAAIRGVGAVPAWVGVAEGDVVIGLSDAHLDVMAVPGRAEKVARRDLPSACARGGLGATTVSATIWAASRVGLYVGATGGIGGVHLGNRDDVSADLLELARTPGLLVCSGPKSIVDALPTVERLEELGVSVLGYRTDRLPHFLASDAALPIEHRVDTPDEAAGVLRAALNLDSESTLLLCQGLPPALALDPQEIAEATRRAEQRAEAAGIRGRDLTPFLLAVLAEETDGRSLEANLALLEANASLAGEVAARMLPPVGELDETD